MKKLFFLSAMALLLLACQAEKKPQVSNDDLKISVRMAAVSGKTATWTAGDIVYLSDDASTRPGFQFKAASGDISADGKTLSATYKSADKDAKTIYAIHAPLGRIRMKKTETINVTFDGTLGGSAMPAGKAAKGAELVLSPIVGVGEFTLKRGYVAKVRISSNKAVFPKSLTYDFGGAGLNISKTNDLIEVTTSGEGPYYVPLVPGKETVTFNVDLMDEEDKPVASGTYEATLDASVGKLTVMGNLDENAVDIFDPSVEEFEKAADAIKNMGVGVNNGAFEVLWKEYANKVNRNDPSSYEKYGGGITTQATMDAYATAGFKSVRIPITWWPHMDNVYDATIDKVWLDRIEEVVNYCKNANLYCIINMHHDAHAHKDQGGQWLFADVKNYDQITKGFQNIWRQIAERFKDYDEWLIFEGYNEITDASETWTFPKNANDITAANQLNQDFVNTVRKTGGKNATRNLVVSTYTCTVNEKPINAFEMPSDLRPGHLIVQVHNYAPTSFCSFSSATKETFGDPQDYTDIQSALSIIKRLIVDKGWPCLLGEYGAPWEHQAKEQQPDGTWRIKIPEEERAKHAYYYTLEALKLGIAPMFWYTPTEGTKRQRGEWTYPKVKDALIQAWNDYNAL